MPKTSEIVLGGTSMTITRNPTASNIADVIARGLITQVTPIFNRRPNMGEISHGAVVGTFQIGETITGGTSGATATLVAFKNTTTYTLGYITGTFVSGETLTGGTSGATTPTTSAVTATTYSGEWKYPFTNMTIIQIEKMDGSRFAVELQEISNQPTWSTGTLAALQQAVADINAWL